MILTEISFYLVGGGVAIGWCRSCSQQLVIAPNKIRIINSVITLLSYTKFWTETMYFGVKIKNQNKLWKHCNVIVTEFR